MLRRRAAGRWRRRSSAAPTSVSVQVLGHRERQSAPSSSVTVVSGIAGAASNSGGTGPLGVNGANAVGVRIHGALARSRTEARIWLRAASSGVACWTWMKIVNEPSIGRAAMLTTRVVDPSQFSQVWRCPVKRPSSKGVIAAVGARARVGERWSRAAGSVVAGSAMHVHAGALPRVVELVDVRGGRDRRPLAAVVVPAVGEVLVDPVGRHRDGEEVGLVDESDAEAAARSTARTVDAGLPPSSSAALGRRSRRPARSTGRRSSPATWSAASARHVVGTVEDGRRRRRRAGRRRRPATTGHVAVGVTLNVCSTTSKRLLVLRTGELHDDRQR